MFDIITVALPPEIMVNPPSCYRNLPITVAK
jgi:hypothetical protein